MAKINSRSTDNPKLGQKTLSDGRMSLYLEYYYGYSMVYDEAKDKMIPKKDRQRQSLNLYLWQAPRTPIERQQNKETLELAQKIRFEKEQELKDSTKGYRLKKDTKINFLDYFQSYNDNYTKKDIKMMVMALRNFKDFLNDTPEYKKFLKTLQPQQITPDMVTAFTEWLQLNHNGEGAKSVYQRFKKVIHYAINHDVMFKNPCEGIAIRIDDQILKKDVLSLEEMQVLINTHYDEQNQNVRRAFILSLYCGLRYCDVKDLKYSNVDYSNKLLKFEQNKTKGHSANSGVIIPLNDGLIELIGEPSDPNNRDIPIFTLPSQTMCLKALSRWVARANINKHITWHCARHSFAVNILNNGANIKTVASLLGHSGLRHTEKYTRAVDSLKQDAINSLPELKF